MAKLKRATLVERVCREEQLPESAAMLCSSQLREASKIGEGAVREVAHRAIELDRERQAQGAQALRESLHLDGVEGSGPRGPAPWFQNGHGKDLLAAMRIAHE